MPDNQNIGRGKKIRPECGLPELQTFLFQVSPAFLSAMDIRLVERIDKIASDIAKKKARAEGLLSESQIKKIKRLKSVLTIGSPPLYSFKPFDMIHAHDERISVQISTATDDRCGSVKSVKKVDGEITFRLYEGAILRAIYSCTQTEFLELLKSGCCHRLGIDVRNAPP